jgi:Carboxypeptidase regulatory-like domain
MNKRNFFLVLLGAGVAATAVLWWLRSSPLSAAPQASVMAKQSATPTSTPSSIAQAPPAGRQIPAGTHEPSDPRWKERELKRRIDPQYEWKMPINFFGRVVDENEQPVPSAKVELSWTDLSQAGSSQTQTTTDAQGFFSLLNQTGRHLEVRVSKDGYYTPKRQQISFDYAAFWEADYHVPDPNNPVLFHIRKKNQGEALRSGEIRPTMPADGTPVRFDLLNGGRLSPDGQLEIAAVTNTEKYPPRIFNWRATILVPGGGLIEHNAEFPFEAPEDGYQPSVGFDMPTNAPDWKPLIEKSYFIEFGSPPRYGRIQVQINGGSQKASVRYWVNPSGSRNLEANSNEQVSSR